MKEYGCAALQIWTQNYYNCFDNNIFKQKNIWFCEIKLLR